MCAKTDPDDSETTMRSKKKGKKGKYEPKREPPTKKRSFLIGLAIFSAIICPFTVAAGFLGRVWDYTGGGIICGLPTAFIAGVIIAVPIAVIFANKASK